MRQPFGAGTSDVHFRAPSVAERFSGLAERYRKPVFASLWARAWGEQYPAELECYSSCTRQLLAQLVGRVSLKPGDVLADLGCGAGGVGLWLARELGVRLFAIDCSPRAVEIVNQRIPEWGLSGLVETGVGDFSATGLEAACVDAAISVDALPFASDVDAALNEVHRILRPGGRLVFTTRQLREHSPLCISLGRAWEIALARNGFDVTSIVDRPEVSALWRSIYAEWIAHERELRAELSNELVDGLILEANEIGPKLTEDRAWLLVTAVRRMASSRSEP